MKCDVFISYRRDGGDMTAMYIYQALKERGYDVFYDLEVLRAGKFNDALLENIRSCKDFVLILSPHALDRCDNENDWVRMEIAEALRLKKNIIPVMLNGFTFPDTLPDEIDDVRYQNGLTATTEYFMESVNRLCSRYLNARPKKKNKGLAAAIAVAALSLAVAAGTMLYFTLGPGSAPKGLPAAVATTEPTAVPTATPTTEPTAIPTATPTAEPTATPTATPTAEPTAVPTPAMLSDTNLPLLRPERLLEEIDLEGRYEENPVFDNPDLQRVQLHSITFLPTLEGMGENAWDVSDAQDGSAMAWAVPSGALYDLYIAGEGGVRLMGDTIFTGCHNLISLNFNGCVDFSGITSMRGMFEGCFSLTHLDLSSLDTSRVTDMCDLFGWCGNLESINLTGFDTSRVTNMSMMFLGCTSLETLDLSSFDTTRVTDMGWMFNSCISLKELDLSSFDTSRVTIMEEMFHNCQNLQSLNISGFDMSRVTNTNKMLDACPNLRMDTLPAQVTKAVSVPAPAALTAASLPTIRCDPLGSRYVSDGHYEQSPVLGNENIRRKDIRSVTFLPTLEGMGENAWDVSQTQDGSAMAWTVPNGNLQDLYIAGEGGVKLNSDCTELFSGYKNMTSISFNGCVDTSEVVNMDCAFEYCNALTQIDLSGLNTSNVTNMRGLFNECPNLVSVNFSGMDTSRVTTMNIMFANCQSLRELDLSGFDTSHVDNMAAMFNGCVSLESLDLSGFDTSRTTDMGFMFSRCENLQSLDLSSFDTSRVVFMGHLFENCRNLKTLDLSGFNTVRAEYMDSMFFGCESLTALDLSRFDTARVQRMDTMFMECYNLKTLDLSTFNTQNVTTMESMFDCCHMLRSVTLPEQFVGPSVENMTHMFTSCTELDKLDVGTWDVSNVKYMMGVFENCRYLLELDVASWNMENVLDTSYMFAECHSLDTLDLSRWNTPNNTDMRLMFINCHALQELNLSSINTQNVTTMEALFENCHNLRTLTLPERFVGPSVISTRAMFNWCRALQNLDVRTWDVSSVTDTNHMFNECYELAALDFSSWDLSRVTEHEGMFNEWPNAPESIRGL